MQTMSDQATRKAVMLEIKSRANNGKHRNCGGSGAGIEGSVRSSHIDTDAGGAAKGGTSKSTLLKQNDQIKHDLGAMGFRKSLDYLQDEAGSDESEATVDAATTATAAVTVQKKRWKQQKQTQKQKQEMAKEKDDGGNGDAAERGCRYCKKPVPSLPWEGSASKGKQSATLFCSHECWEQYSVQIGRDVRRRLLELEGGVCQICQLDTKALYTTLKSLQNEDDRRDALMRTKFRRFEPKRFAKLLSHPTSGQLWQADRKCTLVLAHVPYADICSVNVRVHVRACVRTCVYVCGGLMKKIAIQYHTLEYAFLLIFFSSSDDVYHFPVGIAYRYHPCLRRRRGMRH